MAKFNIISQFLKDISFESPNVPELFFKQDDGQGRALSAEILQEIRRIEKQYADFTIKIKQLFFHKISGFVLTQTSPLIIYAYISLTEVALYDNYMLMILGVMSLTNAIFNGLDASIGNLVSTEKTDRIMSIFEELFSLRFFMLRYCVLRYIYTLPTSSLFGSDPNIC